MVFFSQHAHRAWYEREDGLDSVKPVTIKVANDHHASAVNIDSSQTGSCTWYERHGGIDMVKPVTAIMNEGNYSGSLRPTSFIV